MLESIFNKVARPRHATLMKKDSSTGVFIEHTETTASDTFLL